jgi:hypothetical protein
MKIEASGTVEFDKDSLKAHFNAFQAMNASNPTQAGNHNVPLASISDVQIMNGIKKLLLINLNSGSTLKLFYPRSQDSDVVAFADALRNAIAAAKNGNNGGAINEGEMKKCPDCAEMVKVDAKKCRYCSYRFEN